MIAACKCVSTFQDRAYGSGLRVHNACNYPGIAAKGTAGRCTICGNIKPPKAKVEPKGKHEAASDAAQAKAVAAAATTPAQAPVAAKAAEAKKKKK